MTYVTEQTIAYWLSLILLLAVPQQFWCAFLFLRWRRFAVRRRIRRAFTFASIITFFSGVALLINFAFRDNIWLQVITLTYSVACGYMVLAMFAFSTRIIDRRLAEERAKMPIVPETTEDVLHGIICELKDAGVKPARIS